MVGEIEIPSHLIHSAQQEIIAPTSKMVETYTKFFIC